MALVLARAGISAWRFVLVPDRMVSICWLWVLVWGQGGQAYRKGMHRGCMLFVG